MLGNTNMMWAVPKARGLCRTGYNVNYSDCENDKDKWKDSSKPNINPTVKDAGIGVVVE